MSCLRINFLKPIYDDFFLLQGNLQKITTFLNIKPDVFTLKFKYPRYKAFGIHLHVHILQFITCTSVWISGIPFL